MNNHELALRLKPTGRAISDSVLKEIFLTLCESIDSPKSLACAILFKENAHEEILGLSCDPNHYCDHRAFADDYMVVSFLSKYPYLNVSFNPEDVALAKFFECEDICKRTNSRFLQYAQDPSLWDPLMSKIFRLAREKIGLVLGRPDLDRIADGFGWGPGATSASKGSNTTIYDKFRMKLDVTSNALVMGWCCVNSTPSWVNCHLQSDSFPSADIMLTRESFSILRGNEIVFVPKNAKTHRVIAIEPHVNSYLQKGFGSYIRKRLARVAGVNLNDQTINQQLAREGSLTDLLATIDLSGASDTISTELVRYLLPKRWFNLLDSCRSKQGFVQKTQTWICYNKFSSMGNGYTFELESLIFWALCKACLEVQKVDGVVSVYGDDLIVPSSSYDDISRTLTFAGFSLNGQKSFRSGPFRESCGKDFFHGYEVRPLFLKEHISSVEAIYKLANAIRRYASKMSPRDGPSCDARFKMVYDKLVNLLHPYFRELMIPDGYGDGGLVSNWDEAAPTAPSAIGRYAGWDGWFYRCLRRSPVKRRMTDGHAGYTSVLSAIGSPEPLLGFVSPRGRTYPKVARGHTWEWRDLGPWS